MAETTKEPWHLDKRVPVALIFAIFVQTGAAFWWVGKIDSRVEQLEIANKQSIGTDSRLVRLETEMKNLTETLKETKDILRRIEINMTKGD